MSQKTDRVIAEILIRNETVLPKTFEQKIMAVQPSFTDTRFIIKKEKSGRKLITDWKKQKTVIRTMHPG